MFLVSVGESNHHVTVGRCLIILPSVGVCLISLSVGISLCRSVSPNYGPVGLSKLSAGRSLQIIGRSVSPYYWPVCAFDYVFGRCAELLQKNAAPINGMGLISLGVRI